MKKSLTCLFAGMLASCCIISGTLSRTSAAEDSVPTIAAEEIAAQPGETVSVSVSVQHNPGIAALSLSIGYDAEKLTLLDAQSKTDWASAEFLAGGDTAANPYILNWDSDGTADFTADTVLTELRFAVKENTAGDAPVVITVNQESTFRADFTDAKFETRNGVIHISTPTTAPVTVTETTTVTAVTGTEPVQPAYLRGDVNNSGTVDVVDAQLALSAYTKLFTGKPSGLTDAEYRAANVNLDGGLSVDDAQLILQYYAKNGLANKPTTWEELIQS